MFSFVSTPTSHIKCISTLSKRNLLRFCRDKMDLSITFGQAPILAIAFFLVFQKIVTNGNIDFFQPLREYLTSDTVAIIIFLAVLTAIWFGTSKAITEIPRNRVLYQQENLSFLNDFDFIISNFICLAIIVFVQVFLFSLSFHLLFVVIPAIMYPANTGLIPAIIDPANTGLIPAIIDPVNTGLIPTTDRFTCSTEHTVSLSAFMPLLFIKLTLLMWLIGLASIAVATLISVFVKTPSAANSILPFVLIIQILLGGSIIKPVKDMTPAIRGVADLIMVSRWGFEAVVLLFEDKLNLSLPCTNTFRFTLNLKSINPKLYIETLKKEGAVIPSVVKQHPDTLTSILWIFALSDVDDVKNGKGFDLPRYQKTFDKVSAIYPYRTIWSKEELSQKITALNLSASDSILNQPIQNTILEKTNESFYAEKKYYSEEVTSIMDAGNLNETDELILKDAFKVDSNLRLFRFQHEQTTWLMLAVITISSLFLSWLFFSLQNKK